MSARGRGTLCLSRLRSYEPRKKRPGPQLPAKSRARWPGAGATGRTRVAACELPHGDAVPRRGPQRPPESRVLPGVRATHGTFCKHSKHRPHSARAPGALQVLREGTGKREHALTADAEKAAGLCSAKCPDSPVDAKPPRGPVTCSPFGKSRTHQSTYASRVLPRDASLAAPPHHRDPPRPVSRGPVMAKSPCQRNRPQAPALNTISGQDSEDVPT